MDEPEGETSTQKPPPASGARAEREGRLAKALRENLKRRKALQRPRDERPQTD